MVLGQLFRIVKARIKLVGTIFLITVLTTVVVSLIITKKYTAATTVVVDMRGTDPVLGGAVGTPYTIQSYLSTQNDIIRSQRVVGKVIDSIGLMDNPGLLGVKAPEDTTPSPEVLRAMVGDALLRKLTVSSSREGSTITISYEGTDPLLVERIVNAFADSYVAASVDLKTEPAKNFRIWFEEQSKTARLQLEQAQSKLSAAQQASGIVATDERYDVENNRLNELSQQLVVVQTALSESRSRRDTLGRSDRDSMPDVVANPLIQTLKADLGRAEARLEQLSQRLGRNHPEFMSAQAEVDGLRGRLATETSRVAGSISSLNTVNVQREAELRSAVEAQKAKVMKLRAARDQLNVLEREVQSAQRALDVVTQRFNETNLESQNRASNVSILTRATVPTEPSRPQPLLNTVIGGILGLIIAVLAALTMEVIQRPLRDPEDLLQASGVPVLAVLPSAASTRPQRLIGSTGPTMRPPTLRLGN
ncbi:MAG: chain length determinant protein EpsF [Burkholderiaceae bacterium]